jgi:hypothetical protein
MPDCSRYKTSKVGGQDQVVSIVRNRTGVPVPSYRKAHSSSAHYVRAIAMAAQRLVEQRLLLEEDADRYVAVAMQEMELD